MREPQQVGKQSQDHVTCPFLSYMGSPPILPDWRTLESFIEEGMVLSSLLCVGRGQDCCMSTTGSISDICQDARDCPGGEQYENCPSCLPLRDSQLLVNLGERVPLVSVVGWALSAAILDTGNPHP